MKLKMTKIMKKDFIAIAEMINKTQMDINGFISKRAVIEGLCDYFETQNSSFDKYKFQQKCWEK